MSSQTHHTWRRSAATPDSLPTLRSEKRWTVHPAQEALKEIAKAHGLWNLWISEDLAHAMRQGMPELDEDRKGHTKGRSTGKGLWGGTLGAGLR